MRKVRYRIFKNIFIEANNLGFWLSSIDIDDIKITPWKIFLEMLWAEEFGI